MRPVSRTRAHFKETRVDRTVLVEISDRVATVTLNRPDTSNALTLELARELLAVALRCEADANVRAVMLTGAGKHFCFGGDLRAMREQGEGAGAYINELTTYLHAAISAFARMRAPVIAAVNGTAAGAGVGLVCAADLALCGRGSKFSLAYTGVGLAPDGSTSFLLPRIVGHRRAMELMLLNRVLGGEEAMAWGLVNQVVEDTEIAAQARALATRLATGPTEAYAAVKRLVLAAQPGLEAQMALEGRTIAALSLHPHGREGIAAFIDKRKASFS
jgi:2-(1,2-epoxy-1,2-dihydrophenyl)acetyl-CoA isomerase